MDGCTNGRSFTFGIDERIGFVWPACNPALQGNFEAFTGSTDNIPALALNFGVLIGLTGIQIHVRQDFLAGNSWIWYFMESNQALPYCFYPLTLNHNF